MMRKSFLILGLWLLFSVPAWGTKYAGEFLSLGVGARALGMGGTFVGVADDATASFWNTAGLDSLDRRELSFMHAETFGSLLDQDFIALAIPLREATSSSALAFSLQRLGGGGVKITDLEKKGQEISDTNRVILLREESHADYALFFSYAHQLHPRLLGGVNLKVIYRDVVTTSAWGVGADLSFLAKPYSFLSVGANLMDLTSSFLFYDNGTTETINPTTKLGLALNHRIKDFYLILAADADVRYEGRKSVAQYWLGRLSADMHYGAEVSYQRKLLGRVGLDQGEFTAGAGLWIKQFGLDVAFLSHDELDNTYRVSLLWRF
jgi:hypothetical protein